VSPRRVSLVGALRRRLLTPQLREVEPQVRGFDAWVEGPSIVEPVGTAFLTGYAAAMACGRRIEAVTAVAELPRSEVGFAMEGLAMGAAVRSSLSPFNRHQFDEVVAIAGERHAYMLYVGLGWALARTPWFTWPRLDRFDPMLLGLVLDGFGFHEVFFHTRSVWERGVDAFDLRAWPGDRETGLQHVMQGVGRGAWFVCGGSPERLAQAFDALPAAYHASLWAGSGLAAAYAGGRQADGLADLVRRSGPHRHWVQQGASFAIEARSRAGTVVDHTHLAARHLCDRSLTEVVDLVRRARPEGARVDAGDLTAYEAWRAAVAAEYAAAPPTGDASGRRAAAALGA